jgi:hypothetical protein
VPSTPLPSRLLTALQAIHSTRVGCRKAWRRIQCHRGPWFGVVSPYLLRSDLPTNHHITLPQAHIPRFIHQGDWLFASLVFSDFWAFLMRKRNNTSHMSLQKKKKTSEGCRGNSAAAGERTPRRTCRSSVRRSTDDQLPLFLFASFALFSLCPSSIPSP